MTTITAEVRQVLSSARLTHLTTLNKDGSPQVTVVWIGLEGDEIVSAHLAESHKVRNMKRDPRVVLSLLTGTKNKMGLDEYLVINGRASIHEGGAPELLQRLAEKYIGPGVKFPPPEITSPGFITRIAIERVGGVGPWAPMG